MPFSVTLIGCGKMGGAMLRGWLNTGIAERIHVIEPGGLPPEFENNPAVILADAAPASDVIVLAVKPQMMKTVCAKLDPGSALILSIAAGQKLENFANFFGAAHPVIRAMPNTPAAIGQGITVAVANQNVTAAQRDTATALLQAIGQVEWIANEALMDAVTAVSGSGPAYVFYLIEVLAKAGEQAGLPAAFAMTLARQTVIGSAALAGSAADIPAETLRQNVTSPGGTTAAALSVLMDGRVQALFDAAVIAATSRSRELSQ